MVKVAIIGAGIGGLSNAYYLNKNLQNAEITIYEKSDRIGGRIHTIEIDGFMVEIGAVYFHSVNQLITSLAKELGLTIGVMERQHFGLWDGNKFIYKLGKSDFLNNFRMLRRFGFNLLKVMGLVKEVMTNIEEFYNQDVTFKTVDEMIKVFKFDEYAKNELISILREKGIKEKVIQQMILPTTRYVYLHSGTKDMNGFAGLVSIIAYDNSPVYFIENGNKQLCDKLNEITNADLKLNAQITTITKKNGTYVLTDIEGSKEAYDIVVIATPLSISGIDLEGISIKPKTVNYAKYSKNIVIGEINPTYFNQTSNSDVPPMILTVENSIFPAYGMERIGMTNQGVSIYEFTSTEPLEQKLIEKIFSKIDHFESFQLPYTFPHLSPPDKYDPIILSENLYYLNSVDIVSPTLESSLVMSRNIVKLIRKQAN